MKLTYSIKPVLRLDKKKLNGSCPINFSIRVGTVTARVSSGKCIHPEFWDNKLNGIKKTNSFNSALSTYVNSKMTDWEMMMLQQQSLGKPLTLNLALSYFKGTAEITLFDFFEEQVRLWEFEKKPSTLKSYRSTLNILKCFNNKLNFGDLTYDCIQKFDLYLRKERNNSTNGCFVKHKCLKHIIHESINKGLMDRSPYEHFKVKSTRGTRMFLTIDEVNKINDLKFLDDDVFLQRSRDLFLFSCFTGLRYSDVVNLTWGNIKQNPDRIEIDIVKTNKPLLVPLISKAKDILNKYSKFTIKTDSLKALPQQANQVVNRNLKEIMLMAEINKNISFHCARHSFASNLVEMNTPILYVKDLLGHQKIEQTMIYAKSVVSNLFESMNSLNDKYHVNKHVG